MMSRTNNKFIHYIAFTVLMLCLVPWLSTYLSQMVNVDIAYLTLSAERLLSGELMSDAYYDANPPLSIIVQIPPALLSKITLIPLYYSISIYIFILLTLSTAAYGGVGFRVDSVDKLDGVIEEMMQTTCLTIVDVCVDQKENCFPMIPSGKAHNEMILSPDAEKFDKSLV